MNALFVPRDSWVLSGSIMEWGEPLIEKIDAVAFLTLNPLIRMNRLKKREAIRYGETIEQGGVNEMAHLEFFDWARGYDDADFSGRSLVTQERWLQSLPCPILRMDSAEPLSQLLNAVTAWRGTAIS